MAREEPKDKWAGLAPADRLLHGAPPHLDLADRAEPTPEALKALALEAEDAARAVEGVTNSEGAGAGAARAVSAIPTSHGFAGAYELQRHGPPPSVAAGAPGRPGRHHAPIPDESAGGQA